VDGQLLIVGVLVLLALVYLGRQTLRSWRGKGAGFGNCKCGSTSNASGSSAGSNTLISIDQVRLRRR
jgi:hypothetical protein